MPYPTAKNIQKVADFNQTIIPQQPMESLLNTILERNYHHCENLFQMDLYMQKTCRNGDIKIRHVLAEHLEFIPTGFPSDKVLTLEDLAANSL